MSASIPLDQLSRIERCSEWDDTNETWRISRLQYAGNNAKPSRAGDPGASPMRRRAQDARDGADAPDPSKNLAAAYFSYAETEQQRVAEEEGVVDEAEAALIEAERREQAFLRTRRQQQAELNRALLS